MPAPPITIGELTDVPTFDSAIASPWAQEVTRRCAHRFASTAERDTKYSAASAGAGAICAVGTRLYVSDGATWYTEGRWVPITGTWAGLASPDNTTGGGVWTVVSEMCVIGDLIAVRIVGVATAAVATNWIVGSVSFTPSNLPAAAHVLELEGFACQFRSNANARVPGLLLAFGSGMAFGLESLWIGTALNAAVSAVALAANVPFVWARNCSFTIAGTYRWR